MFVTRSRGTCGAVALMEYWWGPCDNSSLSDHAVYPLGLR